LQNYERHFGAVPYPQKVRAPIDKLPGELALIDRIRRRVSSPGRTELRLGIGDDCALLRPRAGEELAVTTDLSIAGRHFLLDRHPAEAVGHRTLARGLSDLAAMGARPVAAFLSIALPHELVGGKRARKSTRRSRRQDKNWIDRFFDGFLALADATGTPLAGGDLAESPLFSADVVLIGAVRRGHALLRSGARPGHLLYVTGSLGGAVSGLRRLLAMKGAGFNPNIKAYQEGGALAPRGIDAGHALRAHLWPTPRLAQGQWLARRGRTTAAIDISDGLSSDLAHLCEESGVAAELDAGSIPVAPGATLEDALHGGEDYELLFTAPADALLPRTIAGIPITRIGRITRRRSSRPQIAMIAAKGKTALEPAGWEHFA
jgi:thiamine-monophosphate kinase